jgi:ZIP family zinc transporter
MIQLFSTALGIGGSTIFGALLGFVFREKAEKYKIYILAYAAGVMLLAAINGLVLPAVELSESLGQLKATIGIFAGGLCILLPERFFPSLRNSDTEKRRAILTVFAIALHNLPEGIAAGVGFGSGDLHAAFFIAAGIALQNIPEGCVVVAPLVAIGASPKRHSQSPHLRALSK